MRILILIILVCCVAGCDVENEQNHRISVLEGKVTKLESVPVGEYYVMERGYGEGGWKTFTEEDIEDKIDGFIKIKRYSRFWGTCIFQWTSAERTILYKELWGVEGRKREIEKKDYWGIINAENN